MEGRQELEVGIFYQELMKSGTEKARFFDRINKMNGSRPQTCRDGREHGGWRRFHRMGRECRILSEGIDGTR
jgi:hypothetical protein